MKITPSGLFIGVVSFIVVILFFGLVSAVTVLDAGDKKIYDWDNTKEVTVVKDQKYPDITIANTFGLGGDVWSGKLEKNTDSCGLTCSAEKEITISKPTELVSDIRFKRLIGEEWVDSNIRSYQFYVNNSVKEITVDDYENQCSVYETLGNGTELTTCSNVKVGNHTEQTPEWVEYNVGDIVSAGTYTLKLEGEKRPDWTYDWQIKTNGEWIDEWAVWGQSVGAFEGVVSYWSLDESTGATAFEKTSAFDGTAINMENGDWITGHLGNALDFDGTNEYLNTTFKPTYTITDDFAYSFWMNTTAEVAGNDAFGSVSCGSDEMRLQNNGGGTGWRFRVLDGTATQNINVVANLSTNTFNHVVISRNTTADEFNIYVNGVSTANATDNLVATMDFSGAGCDFFIGAINNAGSSGQNLNGTIDEFGIWETPLSAEDVATLYNGGSGVIYSGYEPHGIGHGVPISTGAAQTTYYGMRFKYDTGTEYKIVSVKAVDGAGCDYSRLYEEDGTVLATSRGSNDTAGGTMTFENNVTLTSGTIYRMECNTPSADRNYTAGSFPITTESLTWVGGSADGINDTSWNNIELMNLLIDTASVTLNSPTDASTTTTFLNTFNATASVTSGATLVNMSLYHNASGTWGLTNTTNLLLGKSEAHGFVQTVLSGGNTNQGGMKVTIGAIDINVTSIGKTTLVTGTTAYVLNSDKTVNATSSAFSGDVADFPAGVILNAGETYYFTVKGGTYNAYQKNSGVSYPVTGTVLNWIASLNPAIDSDEATTSWNVINITYTGGYTSYTDTWNDTISSGIVWNVQGCDSDGDCGFATSNFTLGLDATAPSLNVTAPRGLLNFSGTGLNETLNWNVSDANIDSCWYDYNTTNITVTCSDNTTKFALEADNFNLTFWANDTVGNYRSNFTSWEYRVFQTAHAFNASSFETASENFTLTLQANSSLTAVSMTYNNVVKTPTLSNNVSTILFDIPTGIQNNTFNYTFTYGGMSFSSGNFQQNVSNTELGLCNATLIYPYINYTFANENNETALNGAIATSNFTYYLGSGVVTETLIFVNTTENPSYAFCVNAGNRSINVDRRIQYESDGHPQRVHEPAISSLDNTTDNIVLYLLPTADGQYVTFQVINIAEQIIADVFVNATRLIGSTQQLVGQGFTDASGGLTMWLDPNNVHAFVFSKTGYTSLSSSFAPTQTSYTVTLGNPTAINTSDKHQGVTYDIGPLQSVLLNDTTYEFNFTIASTVYTITDWGFTLTNGTGTLIGGQTSSANGGFLNLDVDTKSNSSIIMEWYWTINSTQINVTKVYSVISGEGTSWSITVFFTDLTTYMASGLFGLDGFGFSLIAFLVIFMFAGIMSFRFGVTSPAAVSMIIFSMVFLFDVGLNMLPNPVNAISNFPTIFMAMVAIGLFFREGLR